ncbi:MAG TPA: hypothetical protein VGP69_04720 [Gaiellaceae bacterium]|jgi:hypothetical protein|nr:hypothetical protein [Gaiellaceae bacterium]
MKTILLLTATLAAVTATYLASSSAAANTWTTEHYATTETWHAFADIGKKDNGGPDDIYAAQQTLKTPEGEDVGTVNGYGVNLHPPYVFFHWTATLPSGTLTLESAVNLRTNPVVYSIEGGTGHYAGASGTVTLTDDGSKGTLATIRYRL